MAKKKNEPSPVFVVETPTESAVKIDPQPTNEIVLMGIGKDAVGQLGVYVVNLDIANKTVLKVDFLPEGGRGESIERFKIVASTIFMNLE